MTDSSLEQGARIVASLALNYFVTRREVTEEDLQFLQDTLISSIQSETNEEVLKSQLSLIAWLTTKLSAAKKQQIVSILVEMLANGTVQVCQFILEVIRANKEPEILKEVLEPVFKILYSWLESFKIYWNTLKDVSFYALLIELKKQNIIPSLSETTSIVVKLLSLMEDSHLVGAFEFLREVLELKEEPVDGATIVKQAVKLLESKTSILRLKGTEVLTKLLQESITYILMDKIVVLAARNVYLKSLDKLTECSENSFLKVIEPNPSPNELRKASSLLLIKFATQYPDKVFDALIDEVTQDLNGEEEHRKEGAIIILGILSEYCLNSFGETKLKFINTLISESGSHNKTIRASSIWAVSKFAQYLLSEGGTDQRMEATKNLVGSLLKRFLDVDSKVQQSALTAFIRLIDTNSRKLNAFAFDAIKLSCKIAGKFEGNNLLLLYNIISELLANYPDSSVEVSEQLIEAVKKNWKSISDNSLPQMVGLIELTCSLIELKRDKLENSLVNFAETALALLCTFSTNLKNEDDIVSKEATVKILDLISICFAKGIKINENLRRNFVDRSLKELINLDDCLINHYLLKLIGELSCQGTLTEENLQWIVVFVVEQISMCQQEDKALFASNAAWAFGEIVENQGEQIKIQFHKVIQCAADYFKMKTVNHALAQNMCVCVCKIALFESEYLVPTLDVLFKPLCLCLTQMKHSSQKERAIRGLLSTVLRNPSAVLLTLVYLAELTVNYDECPKILLETIKNIFVCFKLSLKERWDSYFAVFPEDLTKELLAKIKI